MVSSTALVHLPQKVELSETVQPVNLPKTCKSPVDVDVVAIGHGKTGDAEGISMRLKYAELKTMPLEDCTDVFSIFNYFHTYVCAKAEYNGKTRPSICNGKNEKIEKRREKITNILKSFF